MSTLDLVVDEVVSNLSQVPGIVRVVDPTDEIGDQGFIGIVELTNEMSYITLAGASYFWVTMYIFKLGANNQQTRRDMLVLPKLIDMQFMNHNPTTADFWIIEPGSGTKFGSFSRNGLSYQGFSKTLKICGDFTTVPL